MLILYYEPGILPRLSTSNLLTPLSVVGINLQMILSSERLRALSMNTANVKGGWDWDTGGLVALRCYNT